MGSHKLLKFNNQNLIPLKYKYGTEPSGFQTNKECESVNVRVTKKTQKTICEPHTLSLRPSSSASYFTSQMPRLPPHSELTYQSLVLKYFSPFFFLPFPQMFLFQGRYYYPFSHFYRINYFITLQVFFPKSNNIPRHS